MTKSKILSEQFSFLNLNFIDLLRLIDPTDKSKYIDLLFRLFIKSNFDNVINNQSSKEEINYVFQQKFKIPKDKTDSLNDYEKQFYIQMLNVFINSDDYKIFKDFAELNERKLINVDISTVKTVTELSNHVTLGEFKKISKDSENSVQILLRNDKWLILRPLSFESSLKYGKGTKWCTASNDPYNFYRYSNNGILIYIINLETGNKTGFFHNIGLDHETSFWNVIDQRVDSFETDLDSQVLDVLKKEIKENKVSNYNLFSDNEKKKYDLSGNISISQEEPELIPVSEIEFEESSEEMLELNYPVTNIGTNITGSVTSAVSATVINMGDWVTNTSTSIQ